MLRVLEDSEEQLGIWDTPSSPVATSLGLPLVTLKAPNHDAAAMQLCRTMLAVPGKMGDIDVRGIGGGGGGLLCEGCSGT